MRTSAFVVLTAMILAGCSSNTVSRTTTTAAIKSKASTSATVSVMATPKPEFSDNFETREAVSNAIKSCGLRDEVSGTQVWLGYTTAADVKREQMKLDSVRKWSLTADIDSVLRPMYQDALDDIQQHIDEANLELTDHVIEKRQAIYNKQLQEARSVHVPMPPCAPPIPDIHDLHK